ncbi:hypothetical protein [Burkholderia diffusa]|uniref:hypothetical protein n=1 Tax=Burkholderia TaxID=32008 RepID=UPI001246EFC8|nr:hypothetical protein [Burkholderia diffusa]KAB0660236.1 hypothetical protein F7R23_07585 [Burkholderia diffusa]MBM2652484.1 hypothetical protein [Burkholderia diffusa]
MTNANSQHGPFVRVHALVVEQRSQIIAKTISVSSVAHATFAISLATDVMSAFMVDTDDWEKCD